MRKMGELSGNIRFGQYEHPFNIPEHHIEGSVEEFLRHIDDILDPQKKDEVEIKKRIKVCLETYAKNNNITYVGVGNGKENFEAISLKNPLVLYVSDGNGKWNVDGDIVLSDSWTEKESIYDSPTACKDQIVPCITKMDRMTETFRKIYEEITSPIKNHTDYVATALAHLKGEEEKKENIQDYNRKTVENVVSGNHRINERNKEVRARNEKIREKNSEIKEHIREVERNRMLKSEHPVLAFIKEILYRNISYELVDYIPEEVELDFDSIELCLYEPERMVEGSTRHDKDVNAGQKKGRLVAISSKPSNIYNHELSFASEDIEVTEMTPALGEKISKVLERNERRFEELKREIHKSIIRHSKQTTDIILNEPEMNIATIQHPVVYVEIFTKVIAGNLEYQKNRLDSLEGENKACIEQCSSLEDNLSGMERLDKGYYAKLSELKGIKLRIIGKEEEVLSVKYNMDLLDLTLDKSFKRWEIMHRLYLNLVTRTNYTQGLAYTAAIDMQVAQLAEGLNSVDSVIEETGRTLKEISGIYSGIFDEEAIKGLCENSTSLFEQLRESLGQDGSCKIEAGGSASEATRKMIENRWDKKFRKKEEKNES